MSDEARAHLALAADLPLDEAVALYRRLSPFVGTVKVGLSLFVEHGPKAVHAFTSQGARVFLDLKLHDIPNTVRLAASRAAALGVSLLTVHAQGGAAMLEAAVAGAEEGAAQGGHAAPRVLAVTVLTSLEQRDLEAVGASRPAEELALLLGKLAMRAGCGGLVCSPREALRLKAEVTPRPFLCTPGIRPVGAAAGDQSRVETPSVAVRAGADLLVVGRPLYGAAQPEAAAAALRDEVAQALC